VRHAGWVYSLVSSAVLAADVVRHPHASRLADTLDRVLGLTFEETSGLRHPADDAVRRRALDAACAPPRVSAELGDFLASGVSGGEGLARLVTRLEDALLGTLDDLHAMVLREEPVRSLPDEARQVVLDALTSAWVGPEVSLRDVRALAAPWQAALAPVPPPLPDRPWSRALRDLLEDVPRRTHQQWRVSTGHQLRAGRALRWSEALHTASKAAWQAGRLHDVARSQLAATRALALTHTGVSPYASARVVTAAVQAVCTADLIDPGVRDALWADWEAGTAPR
jgi:hypothetical protein